jgi:hypothetical protein
MKPIRVIVHCSATQDSGDRFGVEDIDKMHRAKGFSQVGYHQVIRRSGITERGRPDNVVGAHCKLNNHDSIGICFIGTKFPTVEQIRSFLWLYQEYKNKFQIGWSSWFGHYEIRNTKCPGFPMSALRLFLAQYDERQFDVESDQHIKTFLQAASFGDKSR